MSFNTNQVGRTNTFLRSILFWLCIVVVVLGAGVFVIFDVWYGIDDAYAQWSAAEMVCKYMDANDGRWPRSWQELEPYYRGGRIGASYVEFQHRIFIDFSADSEYLRQKSIESDAASFRVIHARRSFGFQMGEGPNASLRAYWREKAGILDAPKPPEGWKNVKQKRIANEWIKRGFAVRFDDADVVKRAWTAHVAGHPNDDDLDELQSDSKLEALNLVSGNVTDSGMDSVRAMENLRHLTLDDPVTDEGLAMLSGHPALESIDLFGTQVTDEGIQALRHLPKLRTIRYDSEKISDQAIDRLRQSIPGLAITPVGELQVFD